MFPWWAALLVATGALWVVFALVGILCVRHSGTRSYLATVIPEGDILPTIGLRNPNVFVYLGEGHTTEKERLFPGDIKLNQVSIPASIYSTHTVDHLRFLDRRGLVIRVDSMYGKSDLQTSMVDGIEPADRKDDPSNRPILRAVLSSSDVTPSASPTVNTVVGGNMRSFSRKANDEENGDKECDSRTNSGLTREDGDGRKPDSQVTNVKSGLSSLGDSISSAASNRSVETDSSRIKEQAEEDAMQNAENVADLL